MYGYWGKVLRINLTKRSYKVEDIPESIWKKFIGGSAFGAKILLEETPPKVDPLSEENKIIFAVGIWQSAKNPGSGKWSVVTKSPLTKTFLDSSGGGNFAPALKRSGYDALIIEGKSDSPVKVIINNEDVRIEEADSLWGMDAMDTFDSLKSSLDDRRYSIVYIGPSGEMGHPIACIGCDGHSVAGRGGAGAVMGSKNLKAIAVLGTKDVPLYNPEKVKTKTVEMMREFSKRAAGKRSTGTTAAPITFEKVGNLPLKYWSGETWGKADMIAAPYYNEILHTKPTFCANCPYGCHRHIKLEEPKEYAVEGAGPEYETLGMMGGAFLCSDLPAIAKANDICNRMGIDTISTGAWISFLAECYEKNLISKEDTDGIEVNWGDGKVLVKLTEKIAKLEGIGQYFKEGIIGAAKKIGSDSMESIVHVKNMDYPAHDPRCHLAAGLNYATGTRGACHERADVQGFFYPELGMKGPAQTMDEVPEYVMRQQNMSSLANTLSVCKFIIRVPKLQLSEIIEILNAATGWDWSIEDLEKAGERGFVLERLINVRDGITRKDDILPKKMTIPAKTGPREGRVPLPHDKALDEYYKLRNWDSDGIPTVKALKEVGLEEYSSLLQS
ncbi:MAG: aldehyde ferredoxin oxidoreductase family protein [Atribacterota bacterium]|nr:aldehyde ferredoxin oxidoreductase family protein [Atribacterota bacterium]